VSDFASVTFDRFPFRDSVPSARARASSRYPQRAPLIRFAGRNARSSSREQRLATRRDAASPLARHPREPPCDLLCSRDARRAGKPVFPNFRERDSSRTPSDINGRSPVIVIATHEGVQPRDVDPSGRMYRDRRTARWYRGGPLMLVVSQRASQRASQLSATRFLPHSFPPLCLSLALSIFLSTIFSGQFPVSSTDFSPHAERRDMRPSRSLACLRHGYVSVSDRYRDRETVAWSLTTIYLTPRYVPR
jgi:hypothetical protein